MRSSINLGNPPQPLVGKPQIRDFLTGSEKRQAEDRSDESDPKVTSYNTSVAPRRNIPLNMRLKTATNLKGKPKVTMKINSYRPSTKGVVS